MYIIRTKFIAEVGCNHNGDIETAHRMIREAAKAGADFVKFQYYSTQEIIDYEVKNPPSSYTAEIYDRIRKTEFTILDLSELAATCRSMGVQFLCTPFLNPKRIQDLNPFVNYWKIRNRDSRNYDLIKTALSTKKVTLVSTTQLPTDHFWLWHPRIRWIYCIPSYPASIEQLDLGRVPAYHGFSNHIPHIAAPIAATIAVLTKTKRDFYLEIHVTEHRDADVIDKAVSLSFSEFKTIVEIIHEVEKCPIADRPF